MIDASVIAEALSFSARGVLLSASFPIGPSLGPSHARLQLEQLGLVTQFGDLKPLGEAVRQALSKKRLPLARKHKYNAQPCYLTPALDIIPVTHVDHETGKPVKVPRAVKWLRFDSLHECRRWLALLQLQRAGEIRNLQRQVDLPLCTTNGSGARVRIAALCVDFVYEQRSKAGQWERVIEDAKGTRTAMYLLKKRWLKKQDGITVVEV